MRETHERPVCHRAEDLVSYLYGEASPTDALDFSNHLQQCDACRSEFASFEKVHSSIQVWRNETLGASFSPAAAEPALDAGRFVRHERKLSALGAVREFFSVSPLWLRGATVFATLLLCVLAVMMVARVSRKPAAVENVTTEQKLYTEQQLRAEVNKAVEQQKVRDLKPENPSIAATEPKPKSAVRPNRVQLAADRQPKSGHPRALNRQEREQLAEDLRLTLPAEEEDLFLALPNQEHPNQ